MNDDFDLSEWYASDDSIDLVTHVVSPRVTVVEQVNDFGTLGCDVFVDGEYVGSRQELADAIEHGVRAARRQRHEEERGL